MKFFSKNSTLLGKLGVLLVILGPILFVIGGLSVFFPNSIEGMIPFGVLAFFAGGFFVLTGEKNDGKEVLKDELLKVIVLISLFLLVLLALYYLGILGEGIQNLFR